MASDNASSADNQQERLIRIGWILGFVDGEGCFSVGLIAQPDKQEQSRIRRGYKTGYQAFHEFAVTQGGKSLGVLKDLQEYFGVGKIYLNRRYDNHKEHMFRYVVRKRSELLGIIIPFFRSHPLQTSKREDFEKFVQCVEMINDGHHLTRDGMIKIATIASTMNRKKPRESLIRILRDYTPNPSKLTER